MPSTLMTLSLSRATQEIRHTANNHKGDYYTSETTWETLVDDYWLLEIVCWFKLFNTKQQRCCTHSMLVFRIILNSPESRFPRVTLKWMLKSGFIIHLSFLALNQWNSVPSGENEQLHLKNDAFSTGMNEESTRGNG